MNCQEFSEHATEVARAQVMDAALRDRALDHAEGCGPCAARLERERVLSAALRATAESFGEIAAPARVESALLAAFRTQHAAPQERVNAQTLAPAAAHGNVRAFAPRFRSARSAVAASAIAASLILAVVVVRRPPQRQAEPLNQVASQTPPLAPAKSPTAEAVTNAPSSPQDKPAENSSAGDGTDRRLNKGVDSGRPARVRRAAGGQSYKKSLTGAALAFNIDGGQAVFADGDAAGESEVANLRGDAAALTDFVPISAGTSSALLDGGQVVRVEAPRAALASLGMPVDPTRAREKVKADLLLGHDGTAHAIRLVR